MVPEQNLQLTKGSVPPSTIPALCCQPRMKEKSISAILNSVSRLWDVGSSNSYHTWSVVPISNEKKKVLKVIKIK